MNKPVESERFGWRDMKPPHNHDYQAPRILEVCHRLGARRILDLGCGNGALCRVLHEQGFDVVGCEPDREGFEIAQKSVPGAVFHQLGAYDDPGPLASAPFDLVVSTEVMSIIQRPGMVAHFASRVLKPGGLLVVAAAYHGYLKNLAIVLMGKWDVHHSPWWDHGQIKFFSRASLEQMLRRAGFEILEFHGVGRLPFFWKTMVVVARKTA